MQNRGKKFSRFTFGFDGNLSKSKRSQVALIIIIAVVLVTSIVLVVLFRSSEGFSGGNFEEADDIDRELRDCFNQRAVDAVRLVGLQGGYVNLPENHFRNGDSGVAYGIKGGRDVLINIPEMENEIASYLELTMPFCLEDFLALDLNLEVDELDVKVRDDFVAIEDKMVVNVIKGEDSFTLKENYEVSLNVNLGNMYNVASSLVDKHISDPEFIDVSYLTQLNYDVDFVTAGDSVIYTIMDKNELQEVPYSFVFVVE